MVLAWIFLGVLVLFALSFGRMGWRILRGKDEFVAGGSLGHQMTSPVESKHLLRRAFRRFMHQRNV
ncbi:MAG: hypothetical protein ACYDA3_02760 [Gaiellaceae bacterium]